MSKVSILCIVNTEVDAPRAAKLMSGLDAAVELYHLDRTLPRWALARRTLSKLRSKKWDLVYLEGAGIAAGLPLILASLSWRQKFVVSNGDAIAGYMRVVYGQSLAALFAVYERLLYQTCSGYIGRTPYLTGMAVHLGASRAATVIESVDTDWFRPGSNEDRQSLRRELDIGSEHIICGVVGSLTWIPKQSYCYGLELIEALKHLRREDISLLIVGDGDGRGRLESRVPQSLRKRVRFTGKVPYDQAVRYINALDLGFVTQTLDELGSYRITSKLTSYLSCGIPVAMSPIPAFFDYASPAAWPLPACHPSSQEFHLQLAAWLDRLTRDELRTKAAASRALAIKYFRYEDSVETFREFIAHIINDAHH